MLLPMKHEPATRGQKNYIELIQYKSSFGKQVETKMDEYWYECF